jgi:hypothetical protein
MVRSTARDPPELSAPGTDVIEAVAYVFAEDLSDRSRYDADMLAGPPHREPLPSRQS